MTIVRFLTLKISPIKKAIKHSFDGFFGFVVAPTGIEPASKV
jgi:hypothetical protein